MIPAASDAPARPRVCSRAGVACRMANAPPARSQRLVCRVYPSTRVIRAIKNAPRDLEQYFAGNFGRRVMWCCSSMFIGYYSMNMVTLAFGALAINDIVAAVTTLAICEIISRAYYAEPDPPLWLVFANCFKLGVFTAAVADASKLAG